MRYLIALFPLLCIPTLSGCLLVPFVEAASDAGVTASSRQAKLPEVVKKFEEAIYWGNSSDALAYIAPAKRQAMQRELTMAGRGSQIISSEIVSTSFDDAAKQATVVVATKRFTKEALVVTENFEEQLWVFGLNDGWRLHDSRKVAKEEVMG